MSSTKNALNAISLRTGVPLPSLILSFGILHEVTAVVPLVGFFYIGRGLNIGESVVSAVVESESDAENMSWIRSKCVKWVKEGEGWAERVGTRYGLFGFEKNESTQSSHLAGDIANAVFAYGATKVWFNHIRICGLNAIRRRSFLFA